MNEYDSSRMADMLASSDGMIETDTPEYADVVLLNTCSVREKAEDKVFNHLGRFIPLKQKPLNLVIGVGGCVAAQEGDNIIKRAPYVDIVFGPQTLQRLPEMIKNSQASGNPQNEAQAKAISEAILGTVQRVLIEGASWKDASLLAGKTDNNRIVDIAGETSLIHQFVNACITDVSNPRCLIGEII